MVKGYLVVESSKYGDEIPQYHGVFCSKEKAEAAKQKVAYNDYFEVVEVDLHGFMINDDEL